MDIKMVDLAAEYGSLKSEIDEAIGKVLKSGQFIKGLEVRQFEDSLGCYLGTQNVIGCGNGTDALRIALMALDLPPESEIILPAFTYIAAIEVVTLMGFTPVLVDVDASTFNIDADKIDDVITDKTKVIIPTHLFGQCSDMNAIMSIARQYTLYVIEDNAQSLGSQHIPTNQRAGTIGHIGCFSFFPTKVLGAYGDGGALCTNDERLAQRIRMISNHGQAKKYDHQMAGLNSRLDTIQAAILAVKLQYLETSIKKRQQIATTYTDALAHIPDISTPVVPAYTDHVYHQYTLQVSKESRDNLKTHLLEKGISTMRYYPKPTHHQIAYQAYKHQHLPVSEELCDKVLSFPIHPTMSDVEVNYICEHIVTFYR